MRLQQPSSASAGATDTDSMRGKLQQLSHALQGLAAAGGGWGGGVGSGAGAGSGLASVLRQGDLLRQADALRQGDLSQVLRQTGQADLLRLTGQADLASVLRLLEAQAPPGTGAEMTGVGVGSLSSLLHPSPSLHALQPASAPTEGAGGRTAMAPSLWNTLSQQMGMESRVGTVGGRGCLGGVGMACGLDAVSAELQDVQAQVHEALSLSQRQQLQQQQVTELQQHLAHMMQHNSSKVELAALANR